MQNVFTITLANKRTAQIVLLSNLILFLNGFAIAFIAYKQAQKVYAFIGLAICISCIIAFMLKQWQQHILFILAMVSVLVWIKLNYQIFAGIIITLYFLYRMATKDVQLIFTSQKIVEQAFLGKTMAWQNLANVVLKDDLLTLDFKSNKLLQINIYNNFSEQEVQEFNEFCKAQISN